MYVVSGSDMGYVIQFMILYFFDGDFDFADLR